MKGINETEESLLIKKSLKENFIRLFEAKYVRSRKNKR